MPHLLAFSSPRLGLTAGGMMHGFVVEALHCIELYYCVPIRVFRYDEKKRGMWLRMGK